MYPEQMVSRSRSRFTLPIPRSSPVGITQADLDYVCVDPQGATRALRNILIHVRTVHHVSQCELQTVRVQRFVVPLMWYNPCCAIYVLCNIRGAIYVVQPTLCTICVV
eukprot:8941677-Pyramimonas_sp.AAC.1